MDRKLTCIFEEDGKTAEEIAEELFRIFLRQTEEENSHGTED